MEKIMIEALALPSVWFTFSHVLALAPAAFFNLMLSSPLPAAQVKFMQDESKQVLQTLPNLPKFVCPPLDVFTSEEKSAAKLAMDALRVYADSPENKSAELRRLMDTQDSTIVILKTDVTQLFRAMPASDEMTVNHIEALTFYRVMDCNVLKVALVAIDRNVFLSLAHLIEMVAHEVAGHLGGEDRSILLKSHRQIEYDAYERSVQIMEWFARQTSATVPLTEETLQAIRDFALPHERYNWYTWGGPYASRPPAFDLSSSMRWHFIRMAA